VVFAARAAADIAEHVEPPELMTPVVEPNGVGVADPEAVAALRAVMAADVGVVRDAAGLRRALAAIDALAARDPSARFRNMLTTAKLIAAAALARTESRGGHYRSDFPESDPAWRHRTFLTLADAERIAGGGAVADHMAVGA
jgi:L-aspartate oxidase